MSNHFPPSQRPYPDLPELSQQWWMPVWLRSSEEFTRLDKLQVLRHHRRLPPALYGYHNDLSGATGRSWGAMMQPQERLWQYSLEEFSDLTFTLDNQVFQTAFKCNTNCDIMISFVVCGVKSSYIQICGSVNESYESQERWVDNLQTHNGYSQ